MPLEIRSWLKSCATQAQLFLAKPTSANGPTFARTTRAAAGADAADKQKILTFSIEILVVRVPDRGPPPPRIFVLPRLELKLMAQSFVPRPQTPSSESSQ